MRGTDAAEGDYDRATRDPEFLERVRTSYAGHADVLDALWWLKTPTGFGFSQNAGWMHSPET